VGGIGVSVGGIGVSVGGIGVSVGGTGVSVGGTGVSVGGTGVADGTWVGVGCGVGVAVGSPQAPSNRATSNNAVTALLHRVGSTMCFISFSSFDRHSMEKRAIVDVLLG